MELAALKRVNEKNKPLRKDGFVPAVIYGNQEFVKEPINIKFKKLDFEKLFEKVGQHTLVDISIDGEKEPLKVIIKDIQRDFVNGSVSHVDFYCVNMQKEIVTDIPINFVGESIAVRNLGGILVKHADSAKIRCLPGNLINQVELDIVSFKTLEDSLHFRDLTLPDNVELISDKNRLIANTTRVKKVETKQEVAAPTAEKAAPEKAADDKKDEGEKKEEGKK